MITGGRQMIFIGASMINGNQLKGAHLTEEKNETIDRMNQYQVRYSFYNLEHLQFELHLRQATIQASRDLFASKAKFRTFDKAMCNERFWRLTDQGGFRLKYGHRPSDALLDIFQNGTLYGFECATAVVIIFYKAVLDSINVEQFNRIYQGMYLRDWQTDEDLPIYTRRGNDFLPGDCLYFNNPQFDPNKPQWRGENVIDLGNGLYFGHGIGIKTAEGMIESLNKKRKPYATESAYLLSQVTRLDDHYLFQFSNGNHQRSHTPNFIAENKVVGRIGQYSFNG
jgi:protein-glutamine gamma-glutamyltransferase